MEPVKTLLLGAGSRGMNSYGKYALANPGILKVTAAAETDREKRRRIQEEHGIAPDCIYGSWEEAFEKKPPVEAVIIATQDRMHLGPILASMKNNLHILCEKPIVTSLEDCHLIEKMSSGFGKAFMVAHVLKYTPFFSHLKEILDSGRIGRLIGIDLLEHVGHVHMSHSFVRGNWGKAAESSPMILAKSCHDMDILAWLAGSAPESLSSYGALNFFKKENAPAGAPARCLDGCPHSNKCPYDASKIYLGSNTLWPVNVISTDLSVKGRVKALEEGPWGRCVFCCDNDVVDHQTVSILFANGVSAQFTMSGFTMAIHRSIALFGTEGEIKGDMEDSRIIISNFSSGRTDEITLSGTTEGHSGGDAAFIGDFAASIRGREAMGRNNVRDSFESHYMAFAAEASRLDGGKMVRLDEFRPE